MNDRDVMNKIIAKIKALEDVISGGGGGGGSGGSNVIQLTLTAGEEIDGIQSYVVSEDFSTVSNLIANGGYAYILHNNIVYSFIGTDPDILDPNLKFHTMWVGEQSEGVYEEIFYWWETGPGGAPLGYFADIKSFTNAQG